MDSRRVLPFVAVAGSAAGAAVAFHDLAALALLATSALALLGFLAPALAVAVYAAGNAVLCAGWSFGTLRVAPETLFLAWVLAFALARTMADPPARIGAWKRVRGPAGVALAFFAVALASALRAGIDRESRWILLHAPVWIANAIAVPLLANERARLRLVCAAIVVASVALGILSLVLPDALSAPSGWNLLTGHKNPLAHLLSLGLILSVSLALLGPSGWRLPTGLASLVLAAGMIQTGSRAAWLSSIAGLGVFLLSRARSFAPRGSLAGAGLLLVAGTTLVLQTAEGRDRAERAAGRFATIFEASHRTSNRYRLDVARVSLRMAREHPILGAGPGRFGPEADPHRRGLRTLSRGVLATDNEFARTLGELGLLGLGVWVAAGIAAARRLRRTLQRAGSPEQAWAPGMGLAILAHLATLAAFEDLAYAGTFWFLVGVVHACSLEKGRP